MMTVIQFRRALTAYKRANEERLPAEPLHLTLDQWRSFLLEPRAQVIELTTRDGRPRRSIFGMSVVLHPTMESLIDAGAKESSPELWQPPSDPGQSPARAPKKRARPSRKS